MMPSYHDDFIGEYQLPGIGPLRPCVMTFSAQRYEPRPLRPLPTVQIYDSPPESTRQDASELLQIDTLRVSPSRLSVLPLLRSAHGGRGSSAAIALPSPFYRMKEDYTRIVGSTKRKFVDGFVVVWVVVRNAVRRLQDSVSLVTAPLIRNA